MKIIIKTPFSKAAAVEFCRENVKDVVGVGEIQSDEHKVFSEN